MSTARKVAYLQTKSGAMSITCRIATPTSSLLLKTLWNPPHSMVLVHRLLLTLPPLQFSPLSPRALHLIASVAVLVNATISESLLATFMSLVADPVPGNHPRLRLAIHPHRGVRLPGGHCRLVGPLRLLGGEAPPVEPLRLLRDEPHREEPLRLLRGLPPAGPLRLRGESPPRGRLHLSVYLLILPMALRLQRDLFRGVLNHGRGHPGTPSLQGEAPLLQSDNVGRRETLSPLQLNTLPGPPLGSLRKKGQGHGLLRSKLPLPERRRKLTTPQFRPQLRPWSSLLDQTFQMPSPPRLRSPPGLLTCQSRSVSLIQRLPRDLSWAGLRSCLILSSTPRRSSLREFRRAEPATPCSLLFTALRRSPTLRPKAKSSLPTLTC